MGGLGEFVFYVCNGGVIVFFVQIYFLIFGDGVVVVCVENYGFVILQLGSSIFIMGMMLVGVLVIVVDFFVFGICIEMCGVVLVGVEVDGNLGVDLVDSVVCIIGVVFYGLVGEG